MTAFDFGIGDIGGNATGLTVTTGAAQLGARTRIIEKGSPPGARGGSAPARFVDEHTVEAGGSLSKKLFSEREGK